jgi:hypothetical protein
MGLPHIVRARGQGCQESLRRSWCGGQREVSPTQSLAHPGRPKELRRSRARGGSELKQGLRRSRSGFRSWAWWCIPVIPALKRWKQKDQEFKASMSYMARPCLKKTKWIQKSHLPV